MKQMDDEAVSPVVRETKRSSQRCNSQSILESLFCESIAASLLDKGFHPARSSIFWCP